MSQLLVAILAVIMSVGSLAYDNAPTSPRAMRRLLHRPMCERYGKRLSVMFNIAKPAWYNM